MKKITITALFFILSFVSFGQPVLNASDINPLNINSNYYPTFNSSISVGSPGADQIWDFSSLSVSNTGPYVINNSVATAPFASSFPTANFYVKSGQVNDDNYGYYNLTSSTLEILGASNNNMIVANFINPQTTLVFPFAFNTSFTDTYQVASNQSIKTITAIYDGYGTLITQIGTFTDVMRLKKNDNGDIRYTWIKLNPYKELLGASKANGNTFNFFVYEPMSLTTTQNSMLAKFSIAPNPTNGILTISNLDNINSENFINVFDILGNQIIKNESINGTSTAVNISDYASGLYLIKITDANEKVLYTDKIIKN